MCTINGMTFRAPPCISMGYNKLLFYERQATYVFVCYPREENKPRFTVKLVLASRTNETLT